MITDYFFINNGRCFTFALRGKKERFKIQTKPGATHGQQELVEKQNHKQKTK
jgi:hypothetical protein